MSAPIPIEAFHPSEFITDELEARGWSLRELAVRMGGDDIPTNLFALEMYCDVGPSNSGLRMGDFTASQLARAFGTSKALWLNLERAWLNIVAPGWQPLAEHDLDHDGRVRP